MPTFRAHPVGPVPLGLIVLSLGLAFALGCRSEHESFCASAAEKMCTKCFACDSEQGPRLCGLHPHATPEECQWMLRNVCSANDGLFNLEASRACADRIERITCMDLQREGRPDACRRLF